MNKIIKRKEIKRELKTIALTVVSAVGRKNPAMCLVSARTSVLIGGVAREEKVGGKIRENKRTARN